MAYNILSIRSPEDPFDPLYPTIINKGSSVVMGPLDTNRERYVISSMTVWEVVENKDVKLGTFNDAVHTVFLTDTRLVILSPNFKRGDASFALFDMPGLYIASSIISKIKTHNRALVGHLPLVCIRRVSAMGTAGSLKGSHVNVVIDEKTEGAQRMLKIGMHLKREYDPRKFCERMVQQSATAILRGSPPPPEHLIEPLKVASLAPFPATLAKDWVSVNTAAHYSMTAKTAGVFAPK